jgi:hypothetical protein
MGLRSPQDMPKVELRPEATSRLQAGGAPQISKEFIGELSQAAVEREQMRAKRASLIKDAFDNDADTEIVKSTAIVANEEGANALEATRKQREVLKKSLESRFSKLSPEYQERLSGSVDAHLAKYDQTTIPHAYKESKKLEDSIKKQRIVNDRNDAILISGNIDAFEKVGLSKVYAKATEYAQLKYGQDLEADVPGMPGVKVKEIVETTARAAVSETISGAAQEQAMTGNIPGAKAIMERFDLNLDPADKAKAIKVLNKAQNSIDNDQALMIADEAAKAHPDDIAMQEQYIRGSVDSTKLYKSALEVAKYRSTISQKQKQQQEKKAQADVNSSIMDGSFDVGMIKSLAPEKQAQALKFATDWNQKKFIPTDDKTFKELDDMILNSPSDYAEEDLMSYRDKLNDREFRSLKMAQDRIRSEYRSQEKRIASNPDKIISGIRKEYIQNKGLEGSEGEVYKMSREFVEEELARNPKVSPAELRKKYAAALYERGLKKEKNPEYNRFLSPVKNALPFFSETPEEVDVLQSSIIAPEKKPIIHPSYVQKLKKQRPDLSESQILEYLNIKQKEGMDLSIPVK